jgi:DNA helicase-2/ATP-dependent DNA helicase PcrA
MVAEVIQKTTSTTETAKLLSLAEQGKSFLLSGGAGSGKTYSLVEVITSLTDSKPLSRIACITYTNAAVREIEERALHPNLRVSTIHDFLWDAIKHFQVELKIVLLDLINDPDLKSFKILNKYGEPEALKVVEGEVRYKEYVKLRDGVISHDEVIVVANEMFKRYDKLCKILRDCYPFILVDEYQDTQPQVVDILLNQLTKTGSSNVIGFFGDAMQAIYDSGVGDLDSYKGDAVGEVVEVRKEQNRRNPMSIINLANSLRSDGLLQVPSSDPNAPNMLPDGSVKVGSIKFLYSNSDDVNIVKSFLGWDFTNVAATKELNLTHNLIASKAGFSELMRIYDGDKILDYVKRIKNYIKNKNPDFVTEGKTFGQVLEELKACKVGKLLKEVEPTDGMIGYIEVYKEIYKAALNIPYSALASLYVDKDQLIDDKKTDQGDIGRAGSNRDDLIKHLFKIQKNVRLYLDGNYNEFLRVTEHAISSQKDKRLLKERITSLSDVKDKTIQQVVDEAHQSGIVRIDDRFKNFKETRRYIYEQVMALRYSEFQKLFEYLEGFTPFSTQHKTKGREFPNVLVVLNNGKWNSYNFEYLFTDKVDKESVVTRTRKILYVCCTRAKDNLALFYHQPSDQVVDRAKEWFGDDNVVCLDE